MNGICQPCGHLALALQDGYIDRRRHGREPLGHIAGRRSQEPFPFFVCLGARRLRVGGHQPVVIDIALAHAGEVIEPVGPIGRDPSE